MKDSPRNAAKLSDWPHSGVLQASCNIDSDFDLQVDDGRPLRVIEVSRGEVAAR